MCRSPNVENAWFKEPDGNIISIVSIEVVTDISY